MSSWKKASKTGQKFHKERAQLEDRKHLGLLEKKKDYKLRAIDFQQKRDLLINLKRKILDKNPDEFYFNMAKTEFKDGAHRLRNPNQEFTEDEIRLMKSQDKNYIKMHQQMEYKKIQKLRDTMHLIDVEDKPQNTQRFFVDDHTEGKQFDLAKQLNTHEALLDRKSNRPTMEQLEKLKMPDWVDDAFLREMAKKRSKKYKELAARLKRNESLKRLETTYDLKTASIDPEAEYDAKFIRSAEATNAVSGQVSSGKYSKVIARKRLFSMTPKSVAGVLICVVLLRLLGFERLFFSAVTLGLGYAAAYFIMNFTSMFTIVKRSFVRRNSYVEHNVTSGKGHRRASSSSSIQNIIQGQSKAKDTKLSKSGKDLSFEAYFRCSHPWQSVYVPQNIEKALEEIIQNFILTWYTQISADDGLIFEIKTIFRHILANTVIRLKQVDLNYFATFKFNKVLFNHMNDFYRCHEEHLANESLQTLTPEQRIKMQHEFLKFMVNKNEEEDIGGSGHFALKSRQHELVYLRQVTKQIFPLLLPSNILKCRMIMELLEEIVVHKLLLKGLDILAEPEVMNNILVKIFDAIEHSGDRKTLADHNKQVQILKHWCLMNGCIFKSIKSPSLKEIIENNELLHHFIGYMNSTNSVSILQLYLNLREIIQSQEEIDLSSSAPIAHEQIRELKAWCRNPMHKQMLDVISYNSEMTYSQIMDQVLLNEELSDKEIVHSFKDIQEDIFNLMKDIYYTSFIKSDFMYRNMIGLKKLMPKLKKSSKTTATDSSSLNSAYLNLIETRSETNLLFDQDLEQEFDDFGYPSAAHSQTNKSADDTTDSIYEEGANGLEYGDEFLDSLHAEESINRQREIRLDLINEIKDEMFYEVGPLATSAGNHQGAAAKEEEDEEEVDNGQAGLETIDVNLNNLRVCIDDIEEVTDRSNKTCFVFVIQVWNLQPTFKKLDEGSNSFDEVPTWYIRRKYDEFYVLDARLKEFHGGAIGAEASRNQFNVSLPAKQRRISIALQSNAKTLEYLNSIKLDFTKYLQSLITNPILSLSQLIRSFLDPNSIEFGSSIFNDISNLGKMVKGVPYKLRLERGQSLDSFLLVLLQSVKDPKPKPAKMEPICEDIIAESLNNKLFNKPRDLTNSTKLASKKPNKICPIIEEEAFNSPFESFLLLIKLVFKLPNTLCLIIYSLRNMIQSAFDYFVYWLISRKIAELTTSVNLARYIKQFQELIFDNDDQSPKVSSRQMYENAFTTIKHFIYTETKLDKLVKIPILSGAHKEKIDETVENGARLCLEAFQYPILNKQLTYHLLDMILEELFPEMINQKS